MINLEKLLKLHILQTAPEAEEGQGLLEYALVLFFVATVVIAILIILGPQVGKMFSSVTKGLT